MSCHQLAPLGLTEWLPDSPRRSARHRCPRAAPVFAPEDWRTGRGREHGGRPSAGAPFSPGGHEVGGLEVGRDHFGGSLGIYQ